MGSGTVYTTHFQQVLPSTWKKKRNNGGRNIKWIVYCGCACVGRCVNRVDNMSARLINFFFPFAPTLFLEKNYVHKNVWKVTKNALCENQLENLWDYEIKLRIWEKIEDLRYTLNSEFQRKQNSAFRYLGIRMCLNFSQFFLASLKFVLVACGYTIVPIFIEELNYIILLVGTWSYGRKYLLQLSWEAEPDRSACLCRHFFIATTLFTPTQWSSAAQILLPSTRTYRCSRPDNFCTVTVEFKLPRSTKDWISDTHGAETVQ